jgi:hypothetical protein
MVLMGRGATKALVEATAHARAPRIETVFMVVDGWCSKGMIFCERYGRYDVWRSKMMEQMPKTTNSESEGKKNVELERRGVRVL